MKILLSGLLTATCLLSSAIAQTERITYDLDDVWLLPAYSHPRYSPRKMTGSFVWTYEKGKFDEGSGKFTSLSLPWWGSRTTPGLKVDIETKSIDIQMIGNYHGLGCDVTLRLSPPLSPRNPSPITTTTSKFTIEVGVAYKGYVLRGRVVPRWTSSVKSTGLGCFATNGLVTQSHHGLPSLGNGSYALDVINCPATRPAILFLAAGLQTPPIKLPGNCHLYVSPLRIAHIMPTLTNNLGYAKWGLPIPKVNALLGMRIDSQAFCVLENRQLRSSNALTSTIGS